jgi:hypothetical protein
LRRLGFEQLEKRELLTVVSISGYIHISNLGQSMGATANVPVRGVHVHAWIGDNANYNSNPTGNPSAGLNGTGPGGTSFDAYSNGSGAYTVYFPYVVPGTVVRIVAIAESNLSDTTVYRVVQPAGIAPNYTLSPQYACTSQFDETIPSNVSGGVFQDLTHDDTLAAPVVVGSALLSSTAFWP